MVQIFALSFYPAHAKEKQNLNLRWFSETLRIAGFFCSVTSTLQKSSQRNVAWNCVNCHLEKIVYDD